MIPGIIAAALRAAVVEEGGDGGGPALADIEFVGGTTRSWEGNDSNFTPLTGLTGGLASAPAEGDLVLVAFGRPGLPTINILTSGYTDLGLLEGNDTDDVRVRVAYKIMGATPDTQVETTDPGSDHTSPCEICIHVYRNVDPTTPMDVTMTTTTGINGARPNPPAITPITEGAWIVCIGAQGAENAVAVFTAPELTNFIQAGHDPWVDTCTVGMGYVPWPGGGAYDPAEWGGGLTTTNVSMCAASIALRPAPA